MKYSLKNRQFRKRNQIFGQRKRDEYPPQNIYQELPQIREDTGENQQSAIISHDRAGSNTPKLYQFINFQGTIHDPDPPRRLQLRTHSNQPRPGRHGLSPISKPLLNNPNIRLTESQIRLRYSQNFQIQSQTVTFCYRPEKQKKQNLKQVNEVKEIKAVFLKLYSVLLSNNSRIDQLQMVLGSIIQSRNFIARQLNQGLRTALKLQGQSDLYLNTMRSVYQNLRICKLKQQNLELYFKQSMHQRQEKEQPHNLRHIKSNPLKYSLASKQLESNLPEHQLQSRELARLIDYQSDISLNSLNSYDNYCIQPIEDHFKKQRGECRFGSVLQQLNDEKRRPIAEDECQQLSPFDANKMISTITQPNQTRINTQSFVCSPAYSRHQESHFDTFRLPNQPELSNQVSKLKKWLRQTNQHGLKCWIDQMGCLRRPNNTYIFNQKGEVVTLAPQNFSKLNKEGYLLTAFD